MTNDERQEQRIRENTRVEYPCTKDEILLAARANGGFIKVVRFCPFFKKVVEDIITADMPREEIML